MSVTGMHRLVRIAVKDDSADRRRTSVRLAPLLLPAHGGERRHQIVGDPVSQARVNADRGVKLGVGRRHDARHRATGGQSGNEHAFAVDLELRCQLFRQAGDRRGLGAAAAAVLHIEPVPAQGRVGGRRLGWIGDDQPALFRHFVHSCTDCEIVGVLGAAMQHDDEPVEAAGMAGNIQLAGTRAERPAEGSGLETGAVRNRRGLVGNRSPHRQGMQPSRDAMPEQVDGFAKRAPRRALCCPEAAAVKTDGRAGAAVRRRSASRSAPK